MRLSVKTFAPPSICASVSRKCPFIVPLLFRTVMQQAQAQAALGVPTLGAINRVRYC